MTDKHDCHGNATCMNTDSSYLCECNRIFTGNGSICSSKFHPPGLQKETQLLKSVSNAQLIDRTIFNYTAGVECFKIVGREHFIEIHTSISSCSSLRGVKQGSHNQPYGKNRYSLF